MTTIVDDLKTAAELLEKAGELVRHRVPRRFVECIRFERRQRLVRVVQRVFLAGASTLVFLIAYVG
jgi:hypothetical protein